MTAIKHELIYYRLKTSTAGQNNFFL